MQMEVCVQNPFYLTIKVPILKLPPQAKTPVVTYICIMQMEVYVHDRFLPYHKGSHTPTSSTG